MNIKDLVFTSFGYGEIINIVDIPEDNNSSQSPTDIQKESNKEQDKKTQDKCKDKKINKIVPNNKKHLYISILNQQLAYSTSNPNKFYIPTQDIPQSFNLSPNQQELSNNQIEKQNDSNIHSNNPENNIIELNESSSEQPFKKQEESEIQTEIIKSEIMQTEILKDPQPEPSNEEIVLKQQVEKQIEKEIKVDEQQFGIDQDMSNEKLSVPSPPEAPQVSLINVKLKNQGKQDQIVIMDDLFQSMLESHQKQLLDQNIAVMQPNLSFQNCSPENEAESQPQILKDIKSIESAILPPQPPILEIISTKKQEEDQIPDSPNSEEKKLMCEIRLKSGFTLYTSLSQITKQILIQVKTFFNQRENYLIYLDIRTTIGQLKNMIIEYQGENSKSFYNQRLFYFNKELKENSHQIHEHNIGHLAQLCFLTQISFHWQHKGSCIKLANNNLTIQKATNTECGNILGSIAFCSGRHYWEIKIEKYFDEQDIMIGVATKDLDLNSPPNESQKFWGYMCMCARKYNIEGNLEDYGFSCKVNDQIGVLLEFKNSVGQLSFYRNGMKCGVAFNNLKGPLVPAIVIYFGEAMIHLDPKAQMPL